MEVFLTILDKLLPLLYVIAGGIIGLLTPWVNEKVRKRNRKKTLKYELVESVVTYYAFRKMHFQSMNYQNFFARRIDLLWNKLIHTGLTPDQKQKTQSLIDFSTANEKPQREMHDLAFHKLTEIESKLHSLTTEIGDQYSTKAHQRISSLIHGRIREGSDPIKGKLFDYQSKTEVELDAIGLELPKRLTVAQVDLQKESEALITEINNTLKS